MIDTGANISYIPEHGHIMQKLGRRYENANKAIELVNGDLELINKKVKVRLKPAGSSTKEQEAYLYVRNGAKDMFGYQGLIGINHLKLFDMDINISRGKIRIFHQRRLIGYESSTTKEVDASMKFIDNIEPLKVESDVDSLIKRFKKVFSDLNEEPIKVTPMRFFTVHQRPIFAKQRHYTCEEVMEMKQHIKTLLDKNIIEPSGSGYAATSRIIPKKNGSGRLVINYIPLNLATYRDSYALPHISDILGVLQGKEYFSTMDCAQGFYQIDVDTRDRHKTAFSTPIGNFQFRRCPFGARNSCAVFQAAMNKIFLDGLYTKCIIYVDDILVFGKTKQEHDENLNWVLRRCEEYSVKIKKEKCHFAQKEVQYLGFIISGREIKPIPEKVDSLSKSKPPRDKTELRSIIGKLNFYSRFIPHYSKQLEPLRNLLTKNKDYQWKEYHQKAFEALISHLNTVDSQLIAPRSEHKTISLHILSDSLETMLISKENKLISRASRLLSTAEANYSFVEKQLLALTYAVNKFKLLLEPDKFIVRVANKDLEKAISLVNRPERVDNLLLKMPPGFDTFKFEVDSTLPDKSSKKQRTHISQEIFYVDGACKANGKPNCRASWAFCAEYDSSIQRTGLVKESPSNQSAELIAAIKACEFAKTKSLTEITIVTDSKYLFNAATNWIDRWQSNDWKDNKNKPVVNVKLFKELIIAKEGLDIEWIHVKGHADSLGNIRADTLARSVLDTKLANLNLFQTKGNMIQHHDKEIRDLTKKIRKDQPNNMKIEKGTVYYIDSKLPEGSQLRIYVPTSSRESLLSLAHDDPVYGGHLGVKKTFRKLIKFWWPHMHSQVESYVKSCETCQKFKSPKGLLPGYLHSIPVSRVFEHVHLDIVGPLKTSDDGNKYIITATDAFSKWAFARAVSNIVTSEVIKFLKECILSLHGKPEVIITDRGSQFTSKEWKDFMEELRIDSDKTSAYHPQSNGIDERLNGTLVKILKTYVDKFQEKWDDHLIWSLYIYNTTIHESTGYSPYQILFGLDPRSPLRPNRQERVNNSSCRSLDSIRKDVILRNRRAQEVQKEYYDKKRRSFNLQIGQLVYIKIHAPPVYLSKKLYPKWDGPLVIIGFVGNPNEPKAVKVFDFTQMNEKVVAIQDVKPYNDSYKRSEDHEKSQNGEGHTLIDTTSNDRLFTGPFNWITPNLNNSSVWLGPSSLQKESSAEQAFQKPNEVNLIDLETNCDTPQAETPLREFDVTKRNNPISSTPKRVTVTDSVVTHVYDKEQSTEAEVPVTQPVSQTHLPKGILSRLRTREKVDYRLDPRYHHDDPNRDPTYKPPVLIEIPEPSSSAMNIDQTVKNLSVQSNSNPIQVSPTERDFQDSTKEPIENASMDKSADRTIIAENISTIERLQSAERLPVELINNQQQQVVTRNSDTQESTINYNLKSRDRCSSDLSTAIYNESQPRRVSDVSNSSNSSQSRIPKLRIRLSDNTIINHQSKDSLPTTSEKDTSSTTFNDRRRSSIESHLNRMKKK